MPGGRRGQRRPRPDNVLHSRRPRPITGRRLPAPRGATGHARAGGKPGLRAAICGHPGAGRRAPPAPRPRAAGPGRRTPGQGSHSERRTRLPLRLERGAVPLRRASSRAEERVGGPAAGGSDIRATGLATTTAPRAAPSLCGTPGWPRLGGGGALPGREGRASAPRKAPARVSLAAARPHLAVAGAWTPGPGTRVTDASPSGPRFARPRRARPTSCACTGGGAPRSQPISGGRPGTAPGVLAGGGAGGRTSWGARRGAAGGRPGSAVWWRSRTPSLPAPTRQLRGSEREGAAGRGAGGA